MSIDAEVPTTVELPPLPPAAEHLVMAVKDMFDEQTDDSYQPVMGVDMLEMRLLEHIERHTDGKFSATMFRAVPGHKWDGLARTWHMHHLDFQYSYISRGWALLEFEGQPPTRLEAGHSVYQPGSNRHRILDMSEDCMGFEISSPAKFKSTMFFWDDDDQAYRSFDIDVTDEIDLTAV